VPFQLPAPKTDEAARTSKKGPGDGLNVEPVLAECVFYETANAAGCSSRSQARALMKRLGRNGARDAARAVGYARRPRLFLPDTRDRAARALPLRPNKPPGTVSGHRPGQQRERVHPAPSVRNATPNEETACPAGQQCSAPQLRAVVQYRTGGGADLIKAPQTGLSDSLFFAVSEPLAVAPTRDFQELTFDFSATPLPANVADVFLTVVYRGPLGLEPDAVMVAGKDLFEPTPVIFANGTDYFCFNGVLQHVADFSAFPPFDLSNPHPTPPQPRDPTDDGIPDLLGPADEFSVLVKAAAAVTVPSGSNSDHLPLPQRTYGQYTRFVVLQDQPTFVLSELANSVVEKGLNPQRVDSNVLGATSYLANYNRLVVNPDGSLAHQYAGSGTYRGVVTTQFAVFVHQPVADFLPCFAESATKDPLTLIDSPVIGP
jgi:hypothetical protein